MTTETIDLASESTETERSAVDGERLPAVDGEMLRDIALICWASASRLLADGARAAGRLLTEVSRRLEEAEPDRELPGVRGAGSE